MESGYCREILNPYDWLPKKGESSVDLIYKGLTLSLVITYDSLDGGTKQKIIQFKNVHAFCEALYSGPNMLTVTNNNKSEIPLGRLVEYPDSLAARAWRKHFDNRFPIKQYRIVFLSINLVVDVFGEEVFVLDFPQTGRVNFR